MATYNFYRIDEIKAKLSIANFNPLDVLIVGPTGVGKSTTINVLVGKEVSIVGKGFSPETESVEHFDLSNGGIRLWDTPGLGDSIKKDDSHSKLIKKHLNKTYSLDENEYRFIDLVLVIVNATSRDLGTVIKLINDTIEPEINNERILFLVNKCDQAMSGKGWDYFSSKSTHELDSFIDLMEQSIRKRIQQSTKLSKVKLVHYSAENDYRIKSVLDLIINNIPACRRSLSS